MPRKDNGDGSVTSYTTSGGSVRWRAQVGYLDEFGRKERISRRFGTKGEARDFVRTVLHEGRVATARTKKELTLGEWFDWLHENDWPETLAPVTLMCRKYRFERHIRPAWGDVALIHLDPLRIKAYYRDLARNGLSATMVQEIKRDLVRIFNLAIKPYHRVPWTYGNPFTLPVPTPERRDAVALTPDEARRAVSHTNLRPRDRALLGVFIFVQGRGM